MKALEMNDNLIIQIDEATNQVRTRTVDISFNEIFLTTLGNVLVSRPTQL